jgi:hypothetical protein
MDELMEQVVVMITCEARICPVMMWAFFFFFFFFGGFLWKKFTDIIKRGLWGLFYSCLMEEIKRPLFFLLIF